MGQIDLFSNPSLGDTGAGALLVLVVIAIFTGLLVPYRTHKREIHELTTSRDAWRAAHIKSEEARQLLDHQVVQLLETARIAEKFYDDFIKVVDSASQATPQEDHHSTGGDDDPAAVGPSQ